MKIQDQMKPKVVSENSPQVTMTQKKKEFGSFLFQTGKA